MRVDQLATGPEPADCSIRLDERVYPSIGRLSTSMSSHSWHGANVKLYLWECTLTSAADLFQVFEGTVDSFEVTDGQVTLNLLQPRSWNKPCPPSVIDKVTYPNAPDGATGNVAPIVYGNHVDFPMRSPHASAYGTSKTLQEDCGGASGALPLVLVDPGTGAAKVKLLAAGHACAKLLDRANGYSLFMGASDALNPLDATGLTETLSASESYVSVDDDTMTAYYGVRPNDVRSTNTALNAKRAMDVFDETSFATLNQATANGTLRLAMPNLSNLGQILSVRLAMCYSGDAANAGANLQAYPKDTASGTTGTVLNCGVVTSTVPAVATVTHSTSFYDLGNWHFSDSPTHATGPIDIVVDFSAGTTQKAKVYWVALSVKYKPQRNLLTPAFSTVNLPGFSEVTAPPGSSTPYLPGLFTLHPPTYSVDGQFFGNVKGYVDDVGGTYTGTGFAVIERPPDVVRHFLATYGAQTQFETGAGTFGSFAVARDLLRHATGYFVMAGRVGMQSSVQQVVQAICQQSLSCCLLDTQSSKWQFHVWKRGATLDYDRPFTSLDLGDTFDAGATSDVSLVQGIRVQYGYDYFKNRTSFEAFVTALGSGQGYSMPTARDQKLIVTAGTNDWLDWSLVSIGTGLFDVHYSDQLTPGTYTPVALAQHLQTKMRVHQGDAMVRFGFETVSGWNDKLDFAVSAVNYTATLNAGSYTADAYCTECARALNAAGSPCVFTVTYSWATNKFNIAGSMTFTVRPNGGPNRLTSAWFDLGLRGADAAATSQTSDGGIRVAGMFSLIMPQTVSWAFGAPYNGLRLDFGSGTHVATSCAAVIGYASGDTTSVVGYGWAPQDVTHTAVPQTRGNREATAVASQSLYGPKSDLALVADWVRDEASAVLLRDRLFDFGCAPSTYVRFTSHSCPDMQRMRVITFDDSMDARRPFPKYGTDGSWKDKAFRVTEVVQDLGPSYHTEVYAVEA
jgi:hypothetical protein